MATLIVYHQIDDKDHWLASPKREELFGPYGITVRTFINPDDPTRAAVLVDTPDLETFRTALSSPLAADSMTADGVHADTVMTFIEA